jgi:hypothetical protein
MVKLCPKKKNWDIYRGERERERERERTHSKGQSSCILKAKTINTFVPF